MPRDDMPIPAELLQPVPACFLILGPPVKRVFEYPPSAPTPVLLLLKPDSPVAVAL